MGLTKGSKKKFAGIQKHAGKQRKTKRYYRDVDQIHEDMKPENKIKLLNQPKNIDLAGDGQNYCLHCARHFVDQHSLKEHFRSKVHKKRLKELRETPYTQEEAERASGMGNYIPAKKIKISTELPISNNDSNTEITN